MRRLIFPVLLGLVGAAILVALGAWQLQRLEWKTAALAKIDAKIAAAPVPLPATVTAADDIYLPVTLQGRLLGPEALVLIGLNNAGVGYRYIAAFEEAGSGRKIMVDFGFVADSNLTFPRPATPLAITGNLNWPSENDSYTPEPDLINKVWFARDVARMANVLRTEQILVVARAVEPAIAEVKPLPVDSSSVPNDHLNYAITWFSLAVVWLAMTGLLIWRIRRQTA